MIQRTKILSSQKIKLSSIFILSYYSRIVFENNYALPILKKNWGIPKIFVFYLFVWKHLLVAVQISRSTTENRKVSLLLNSSLRSLMVLVNDTKTCICRVVVRLCIENELELNEEKFWNFVRRGEGKDLITNSRCNIYVTWM